MSTNKRKCCQMKKMTGKEATTAMWIEYRSNLLLKTRKNVAIKATIIAPIDMKSVASPIINLLGNVQRKFRSAYREVRIDKKVSKDEAEVTSDIASDMAKNLNAVSLRKTGVPVSCKLPPGKVKAAAKTTVAISVATSMHESAVSPIHCSPSFIKSLCCSINKAPGVFP